jgi:hypothetical protein
VIPGGGYAAKGFYLNECPATSGDFLVYGGTAPYTARSALPNAVFLSVDGATGDPVTISQAGGSFRASTSYSSNCGDYSASIVVTDATGRIVTVTYAITAGTNARPAPPDLALRPDQVDFKAVGPNCNNRTVTFTAVGGSGSGTYSTSKGTIVGGKLTTSTATATGDTAFPVGESITVSYVDATLGKLVSAKVNCVP